MEEPSSEQARPVAAKPAAHGRRRGQKRGWLGAVLLTGCLLGMIALSIRSESSDLAFVLLGSVLVVVTAFHRLFPGSQFFTLALTNFIGVYACVFALFLESSFRHMVGWVQGLGFALPLAAFVLGSWWQADEIRNILQEARLREGSRPGRVFFWLAPVTGIGVLTFGLPGQGLSPQETTLWFLLAMSAIATIVGMGARDVAVFLLDAGLLFEGFFQQTSRLVLPAFAFLTFYSLIIIVFGTIYTIMDRFMVEPNFLVHGDPQKIGFTEGLYFSLVTFATVGYGDVSPLSGAVRIVAAIEIVMGVLLLLFGFSAIIGHSTPVDRRRTERDPW